MTQQPTSLSVASSSEVMSTEPPTSSEANSSTSASYSPDALPRAPHKPSAIRRILNWFWRGVEIKAVRGLGANDRKRNYENRARTAAELGRRALEPVEPLRTLDAEAPASDLYAQSIHWALKALRVSDYGRGTTGVELATSSAQEALDNLWIQVDPMLLVRAAGSEQALAELHTIIEKSSFVERAELPREEQARVAALLRRFAEALLSELELPQRAVDVLRIQRVFRIGLVFVVLGVIAGAVFITRDYLESRNDIARGKPWRASSLYASPGCRSPDQTCAESPNYFVHTREEEAPWVEFDLGKVQPVSAVRIDNRKECCFERAVPLVVEVSTDGKAFRQVSRHERRFNMLRAKFAPVQARYVRLRVAKRGILHLSQVRILP